MTTNADRQSLSVFDRRALFVVDAVPVRLLRDAEIMAYAMLYIYIYIYIYIYMAYAIYMQSTEQYVLLAPCIEYGAERSRGQAHRVCRLHAAVRSAYSAPSLLNDSFGIYTTGILWNLVNSTTEIADSQANSYQSF